MLHKLKIFGVIKSRLMFNAKDIMNSTTTLLEDSFVIKALHIFKENSIVHVFAETVGHYKSIVNCLDIIKEGISE